MDDDAAIMEAVAAALESYGLAACLLPAEAADAAFEDPHACIFAMCEQEAILTRLQHSAEGGAVVVNSPRAIRNTYRTRTLERFTLLGVPSPASWILPTHTRSPPPAAQVWIKRADFHATEAADVLFAGDEDSWFAGLERFARRGMAKVVVQAHAPGDLVKFYGVLAADGAPGWFDWFYHEDRTRSAHRFEQARLSTVAFQAAAALGVEVFGGDAIIGADGTPVVIDLNAWPSFAVRRETAARAIAQRLAHAFGSRVAPAHPVVSPQAGVATRNG